MSKEVRVSFLIGEIEYKVYVECYYSKPCKGSRNEYGVPMEPDYPGGLEDWEINKIINLKTGEEPEDYDNILEKIEKKIENTSTLNDILIYELGEERLW